MKSYFNLLLFVLFVGGMIMSSQQAQAQATLQDTVSYAVGDTMFVAWAHKNFVARVNALRSTIMGDTAANGTRADLNRVYKLKMDGYYYEADDLVNANFPLRIVGDPMNTIPTGHYPPILQMADTREDGTTGASHLLTAGADVTLQNIFITGRLNGTGAQTAYQPILFAANNCNYSITGCVFEQSNFALVVFTGANNNCVITDNKFRNLEESPVTQQYTGRGISIWTDEKSVIIENNTFFNLGFVTFQMEGGSSKYLRYNHNTIIGTGRGIMSNSGDWWQEAYFANNLIINAWWEGERFADTHASGRDPRETHNGMFIVGPLPSSYGPQQARRFVVTKQYAFLDPLITAKYGATPATDTIVPVAFTDPVSALDYLAPYKVGGALKGHMYVADTNWLASLPAGFTNYLTDNTWLQPLYPGTNTHMVDSMWSMATQIYAGATNITKLFYHPSTPANETWPLPESGSYTDATLKTAGTDGLPIGDLNYFPTQKATFLANQAAYVAAIEGLAGPRVSYPVDSTLEAEKATVGGTAAVAAVQGLTFYDYNGNGNCRWTFTAPDAGQYDTKWYVNMTGRGQSGPCLAIDDSQFVDRHLGWGQFVFDPTQGPAQGLSNSAWVWVPIVADSVEHSSPGVFGSSANGMFTFAANSVHTIGVVAGGWGEVKFAEIDIVKHGNTDTLKLKAPDAVADLPAPGAEGVVWVASGFKYVNMGSAGTISTTFKAPITGTYHLRTFYQNTGSAQSITIKEGSTLLSTESFAGLAAGTGLDNFSAGFSLTSGNHTLTIAGGNVNIDYFQLVGEVTRVKSINSNTPVTFTLDQNYPNPFNPTTTINFSLGKASDVTLTVYNILGQKVATLVNGRLDAGVKTVQFDAKYLASGVYFYRLEAGSFVSNKKMLLLK